MNRTSSPKMVMEYIGEIHQNKTIGCLSCLFFKGNCSELCLDFFRRLTCRLFWPHPKKGEITQDPCNHKFFVHQMRISNGKSMVIFWSQWFTKERWQLRDLFHPCAWPNENQNARCISVLFMCFLTSFFVCR